MNKLSNTNNPSTISSNSSAVFAEARNMALQSSHYKARVTRINPAAVVIMMDQSGSMSKLFFQGKSKAEALADIVNSYLEELFDRCVKEDTVRDYFEILIIGYGHEPKDGEDVSFSWEGNLAGRDWVKVSELKNNTLRVDTKKETKKMPFGDVLTTISKKIWIEPKAFGLTPMLAAFELCFEKLEEWVDNHSKSFPPMVFNITDGYPTDIDELDEIIEVTDRIKELSTVDGETLVFNALLKPTKGDSLESIMLPTTDERFYDKYHKTLYQSSSELPRGMSLKARDFLRNNEFNFINPRGVVVNGDVNCIVQLLNIGTSTSLDNAE